MEKCKSREEVLAELEDMIKELPSEEQGKLSASLDHFENDHGFSRMEAILYLLASGVAIMYSQTSVAEEVAYYAGHFGKTQLPN